MDSPGVSPVMEVAGSLDAFTEEEYDSQSKLYKQFTNISIIEKAWTLKSSNGTHTIYFCIYMYILQVLCFVYCYKDGFLTCA